jgi:hypothetical protein
VTKIFRIDVQIAGTAYIKADSEEDAMMKVTTLNNSTLTVEDGLDGSDVPISGRRFTDPLLPQISLSPAMTLHGVWPGAEPEDVDD